jgi:hypothetical protein
VLLCQSAIVELTRAFLGSYWDTTESVFPSTLEMKRKKKRTIFQILNLILKDNPAEYDTVCWEQPAFWRLNMSKDTAKHLVTKYKLRQIVYKNMVRSVEHHAGWVRNMFKGYVLRLPIGIMDDTFPVLKIRGQQNTGYDTVQSESVAGVAALRPKRVQFRKIEHQRSTDRASHYHLQKYIKPLIASKLGVSMHDLELLAAFLRSLGYAPQIAHFDYPEKVLEANGGGIYLGLTPLTENGAFLQLWDRNGPGRPGNIVFIPYGFVLILPGDTVHGGGFHQCFLTMDLRLHFYVYVRKAGEFSNSNSYQSLDEYPMHNELSENEGLLHAIFSSDTKNTQQETKGSARSE